MPWPLPGAIDAQHDDLDNGNAGIEAQQPREGLGHIGASDVPRLERVIAAHTAPTGVDGDEGPG